jgi:hypothetical protein
MRRTRWTWLLLEHERAMMAHLLVIHDEQLAAVLRYRYLAGLDRLQHFVSARDWSPILVEKAR